MGDTVTPNFSTECTWHFSLCETIPGSRFGLPGKNSDRNIFHAPAPNRIIGYRSLRKGIMSTLVCKNVWRPGKRGCSQSLRCTSNRKLREGNVTNIASLTATFLKNKRKSFSRTVGVREKTVGIATVISCHCKTHPHLFETESDRTIYEDKTPQTHQE